MPRSYESDEKTFQKLRAAGKTSWDEQADPHATFDTFIMRPFLEESLAQIPGLLNNLSALEIGCGTGPISCFLAAKGLTVRGIDISPTALEMARHHAAQRGLRIHFDSADICRMPAHSDHYDLVIDGHCLHYFVHDEHRRAALAAIHCLLKPAGLFLIETMISHPALIVGPNYRLDPNGVLSIKVDDPAAHDGAFPSGTDFFAPHRRLLTENQILTELRAYGFTVHSHRAVPQKDPKKPMLLQIRARLQPT